MIISKTPLRVSFFGGGTDVDLFYNVHEGCVLSATIDKYIYTIIKMRYDNDIVLNYKDRERVSHVNDIKHNIFREALKIADIKSGVEITNLADIPSEGSGLGSSSSFTVGLLNALFSFKGESKSSEELAKIACKIEIETLREPIGKQDQYAAALGGLKNYFFHTDGTVTWDNLHMDSKSNILLNQNMLIFFTGVLRKASDVLEDQNSNISQNIESLIRLKEYVKLGRSFLSDGNIKDFGYLLDQSWMEKKTLSSKISNFDLDTIYNKAMAAGAFGGKLLGAGGGGFFLFVASPEKHNKIREALSDLKELPFSFEKYGSRIVFASNDHLGFIQN